MISERKLNAKPNIVNENENDLTGVVFIFLFQILRYRIEQNLSGQVNNINKEGDKDHKPYF